MTTQIQTHSLTNFLRAVDTNVIRLGIQEYLDVQTLLRSRKQWDSTELRYSLAARLATNPTQAGQINVLFDRYCGLPEPETNTKLDTPKNEGLVPTLEVSSVTTQSWRERFIMQCERYLRQVVFIGLGISLAVTFIWFWFQIQPIIFSKPEFPETMPEFPEIMPQPAVTESRPPSPMPQIFYWSIDPKPIIPAKKSQRY